MQKPRFTLLALVILFVFMPVTLQSQEKTEIGKFRDAACPFPLPEGIVPGENFKFGYVSVPELHSDPGGQIIELAVAIFPSTSEIHQPDPLVMNTSGPGKSNMDNFIPDIAGGLGAYLLPQRDVVIIELRGLRYSRPFLSLDEVREARLAMMDKNLGKEETMDILRKAMQASLKRFEAAGVNLSAYNNVETAADIALVMEHLGYEKFNIVGSSAGTMVAHHVIRDYPERIRCGVMDAGLPLNQDIMINYVPNLVTSLKNYFEECRNDPDCHAAFPDLESRFLSLLASLNEHPLMLKLTDPLSGKEFSYALNGFRLSENLFFRMFYSTQVPLLISQVLEGDYQWLIDQLQYSLVPNYFADGLGLTVFITETDDYALSDIAYDPAYNIFSEGVSISGIGGEYFIETNKIWKLQKLEPERVRYPEARDVPVMVVNGKYDPVIPVKYDEVMRQDLNNVYIYRFDGVPHSAFDNATPCVLPMLLQFLNDPSKAPDNSCMENYKQVYRLQ